MSTYHEKKRLSIQLRRYILTKTPCKDIANLIGAPREIVRNYLQSQFLHGMTWENYGKIWHIDHIAPVSCFDLSSEKDRKLAWHFLNLRPQFADVNRNKGGSIFEAKHELQTRCTHAPDCQVLKELCERVALPSTPASFYSFLKDVAS